MRMDRNERGERKGTRTVTKEEGRFGGAPRKELKWVAQRWITKRVDASPVSPMSRAT